MILTDLLFFPRIFTIAPKTQNMFKKFDTIPFQELPENEHFRGHALQVTETIALAVSSLADMDELICVLKDLGAAHSTHGLNDSYFDVSSVIAARGLKRR